MIWAAIWGGGYTEIYRMSQDEASMRRGQDNAPLHTANIIKNWFHEHGIPLVDWPSKQNTWRNTFMSHFFFESSHPNSISTCSTTSTQHCTR